LKSSALLLQHLNNLIFFCSNYCTLGKQTKQNKQTPYAVVGLEPQLWFRNVWCYSPSTVPHVKSGCNY